MARRRDSFIGLRARFDAAQRAGNGDGLLPNQTKPWSGDICDLDAGFAVASRPPSPIESALLEEYRRTYTNRIGHAPLGLHVIANPSNPEGLAVLYRGELGLCMAKGPDFDQKLNKETFGV